MVRYKSNQSNRSNQSETKLLSKTKTRQRPKTRLKRKLLVYRKEGRFYIDHSAAYALKLTNVRAIMTENPRLIEIGIETLYRFQNDPDIEIVYQELNKDNRIKTEKFNLTATLDSLEKGKYGIGIHGIDKGSKEEKLRTADSISNEGLNINNNSKTILSTAISLGTNEDMQRIGQEINGYKFGNGTKVNVIIAVPLYIENQNGEKIFLGFPEQNKRTNGQQYDEHCILDRICSKMKKIPPQFILGYYCENQDGTESFVKNGQHYSNLTPEDRENLFAELSSNMDDVSRNYNELIASGNSVKLSQIKERMQQLGLNLSLVDNVLTLAQKYKGQANSRDNGRKTRRIFLDTNKGDESNKGDKLDPDIRTTRKRKILLDACKGITLSDVNNAEGMLGLEIIQGKGYKGEI